MSDLVKLNLRVNPKFIEAMSNLAQASGEIYAGMAEAAQQAALLAKQFEESALSMSEMLAKLDALIDEGVLINDPNPEAKEDHE